MVDRRLTRVVERRAVAADAAVRELERPVLDDQLVGHELLAVALVAGDDARDRALLVEAIADPDADPVADAQPLPPPRVLDLELDRPDAHEVARLPGPREVLQRVPAAPPRPDLLEREPLLVGGAAVEVQDPRPRRALLVVAVARRHRARQAGEVDPVRFSLLDDPREHAEAEAV